MSRRLDETDLHDLQRGAGAGFSHPTDVLRLVEEVRELRRAGDSLENNTPWEIADRLNTGEVIRDQRSFDPSVRRMYALCGLPVPPDQEPQVVKVNNPNDYLFHDSSDQKPDESGVKYDFRGLRLVPTQEPVDGVRVVLTDCGPMKYDPPPESFPKRDPDPLLVMDDEGPTPLIREGQ